MPIYKNQPDATLASMTKEEIIIKVKSLNFPKNSYVVFGSGPLAVAGLREVNDIDLLVSKDLYNKLKTSGWEQTVKGPKDRPLTRGVFEAHDSWDFSAYSPSLEDLLKQATVVDGVPFASLEDVQKWKTASGRPKDLTDLELINGHNL